jgi:hypothetical protein
MLLPSYRSSTLAEFDVAIVADGAGALGFRDRWRQMRRPQRAGVSDAAGERASPSRWRGLRRRRGVSCAPLASRALRVRTESLRPRRSFIFLHVATLRRRTERLPLPVASGCTARNPLGVETPTVTTPNSTPTGWGRGDRRRNGITAHTGWAAGCVATPSGDGHRVDELLPFCSAGLLRGPR